MEVVPGDLALIVNKFFEERPKKMRGFNIDVFVSRVPFHDLIKEKDLDHRNDKFWITKTIKSLDKNQTLDESAIHFINCSVDFVGGYDSRDSFVLEVGAKGFCLITRFRRPHHNKLAGNLIMRLYPSATRAYLTELQMQKLIETANKRLDYDLRVRSDYFLQESTGPRDTSGMEYHRRSVDKLPTVRETFKMMRNVRRTLNMAKLMAANKDRPLEITFSADGHVGLYKGNFEDVFTDFVFPIIEISSSRVRQFSSRSMSETEDKMAKPITLDFKSNPWSGEGIPLLLTHIRGYTHCNYSIVHAGNPHLFMYIMDQIDHSTFSIRTLGLNRLVISPQVKTSAESMARFMNHVLSEFGDGEITGT